MTPDVNVLLAASRSDHPHHGVARAWLEGALKDCQTGGAVEILPMVAAGFLRLATSAKVFAKPTPIADAMSFVKAVLRVPGAVMPELGTEWPTFEARCLDLGLKGNQIPDAWIAAAVDAGGYHLVTFDGDFRGLLRASQFTLLKPGADK